MEKKRKKRWFIYRLSNEERGNTENGNLMMPLTCSSISKHLRRVLFPTVLHHQCFLTTFQRPMLSMWNLRFGPKIPIFSILKFDSSYYPFIKFYIRFANQPFVIQEIFMSSCHDLNGKRVYCLNYVCLLFKVVKSVTVCPDFPTETISGASTVSVSVSSPAAAVPVQPGEGATEPTDERLAGSPSCNSC